MVFILVDDVRRPTKQEDIGVDSLEKDRLYRLFSVSGGRLIDLGIPTGNFIADNYGVSSNTTFRVQEIGGSK